MPMPPRPIRPVITYRPMRRAPSAGPGEVVTGNLHAGRAWRPSVDTKAVEGASPGPGGPRGGRRPVVVYSSRSIFFMRPTDLRGILRYVPQFREKTFVIAADGAVVADDNFGNILLDVAVL